MRAPPSETALKEWPLPLKLKRVREYGDPSKAVVISEFPGAKEPTVNPYWLVELNGQQFYRMKTLSGELFYFDLVDLPLILRIDGEGTPVTTWYKNKTGQREKEGYIVCRTLTNSPRGDCHLKLHHIILGDIWTNREDKTLTVDHRNWNKWDNRRINLRLANQTKQLTNRDRLEFKQSNSKRTKL